MGVEGRVGIEGLRDLTHALKQMDPELVKAIRVEFRKVSVHVVTSARGKMPRQKGKMIASVKPRAGQNDAGIAAYGPKVPYGHWMDFGGTRMREDHSHAADRPFYRTGRYIFPTIAEEGPVIMDAAEWAIDTVLSKV